MPHQQIGRLALREEGKFWNAYYAQQDSMKGALHLGSIRIEAVKGHLARKQAFIDMMRDLVSDLVAHQTGVRPGWGTPEVAPEHERGGHG